MKQTAIRIVAVLALVTAALLVPTTGSSPASTAQAANLAYFDPGNIISDAVFYDYLSMNAGDVQGFLNGKGGGCTAGSLCIKNYVVDTTNRSADNLCAGYTGTAAESAATIIAKVAVSCGVNPRVLLVVLQKEQGLVTATSPTQHQYDRAAGYACPDSANGACDPSYVGLENQLYWSAWQYKRYRTYPNSYNFIAGQNNTIAWSPNAACGSSTVFIANQATAGLYDYTPYRPDQAALDAGYGSGDSCSAYGNRNFWNYFTDWFGSTQSSGATAILNLYQSLGGSSGWLGAQTSGYLCSLSQGGCWQAFQNGSIYWTPNTGAHFVHGAIRVEWGNNGYEGGFLGFPVTDENCGLVNSGCWQQFQGGSVYWSPSSDVHFVRGAIRGEWASLQWENSFLGYPTTDESCGLPRNGCSQTFQGGSIYYSPDTGAHFVRGAIAAEFGDQSSATGFLGYPRTDEACGLVSGGCWQQFQGGSIYWSPSTNVHFVRGAILGRWSSLGWEHSSLGYPTSDESCSATAPTCTSNFQNGSIVWGLDTGSVFVTAPTLSTWVTLGGVAGTLGKPRTDTTCGLVSGGCFQAFDQGSLYSSAAGTHLVRGAILGRWGSMGWERSSLGYPTSDEACLTTSPACTSTFQNGAIVWSPSTGPIVVAGPTFTLWNSLGGTPGTLGKPLADAVCDLTGGGCAQTFDGGSVYWTSTTGAHFVRGAIRGLWSSLGSEKSSLGYPTTDETCGLAGGGCSNQFEHGSIYWSPTTGVHSLSGPIRDAWVAQGSEGGTWGYPTGEPQIVPGGVAQVFANGTASYSTSSGAVTFR